MAGPTPGQTLGIIVFGHMSAADVDELCSQEPFTARGYREYEVIPRDVHHLLGIGGFDVKTMARTCVQSCYRGRRSKAAAIFSARLTNSSATRSGRLQFGQCPVGRVITSGWRSRKAVARIAGIRS